MFNELRLVNFRNYQDVKLTLNPRVNVFLGENGQGKTNLLEALYMVSQGESFRYANNSVLIKQKSAESIIQSDVTENDLNFKIQLAFTKTKKIHTLNGNRVQTSDIKKKISSVIFSPESLSSIKEGADHRRNLIDELLITFDRKNALLLSAYRKILKTRNKVLKNYTSGLQDKHTTEQLLDSLSPQFINLSTQVSVARIEAINGLMKDFNHALHYISQNNNVDISVEYLISSLSTLSFTVEQIEHLIIKRLIELHDAELSTGNSLVGPHKHDIVFLYNQNDSRFFCSQGQQRAIILSFKIAQIVYHRKAYGSYPVLMLDDVLSELDKSKRDALISFLQEINTQIFVTTTDFTLPNIFSLDQLSVMHIKDGLILD